MSPEIDKAVLKVRDLLVLPQLSIPSYQRPYRWGMNNISALFADIGSHLDKSAYRLGTVVFHLRTQDQEEWLDIVDGQQRTVTLLLAVKAIIECRLDAVNRQDLKVVLKEVEIHIDAFMLRQRFASLDSEVNLWQNYQELRRIVRRPEFTEAHIDFMLNRCEVVTFVLDDISEAFQFFDSQNARGRDLAPHDLLKAFHLREFSDNETALKADAVAHWERLQSESLAALFATFLFRVRQWAEGRSARFFGKGDVDLFKGVNLDRAGNFPYAESLRIAHHFIDDYNSQYQRKVDGRKMGFPFRLDQTIINGRRFFEMAEQYQRQISAIIESQLIGSDDQPVIILGTVLGEQSSRIIRTLNRYEQRTRPGDKYVRSMFDCALIFYIDKFGTDGLSAAIEKCFIWAYRCRIRQQVVQLATMDNYVLDHNLIRTIGDARQPSDVHSLTFPTLTVAEIRNNRGEEDDLVRLFREMKYYA